MEVGLDDGDGGGTSRDGVLHDDEVDDQFYLCELAWRLEGNAGTTPGTHFLGTTDARDLHFKVNGVRALLLDHTTGTVNLVGGSAVNTASGQGGVVSGGGTAGAPNRVTGDFGTVGGGRGNTAGVNATIAGGGSNTASGLSASVGGGVGNSATSTGATIGGGLDNRATEPGATVGGGSANEARSDGSTVSGGALNWATEDHATVGGGFANDATGIDAVVAGGTWNQAGGESSAVGGGDSNLAGGAGSTVSGGWTNRASGLVATVAGGAFNNATGEGAIVVGGAFNDAVPEYSVVVGGNSNEALGEFSFAAGCWAQANHNGAFVWSGHQGGNVCDVTTSTAAEQFVARAHGGFRFLTGAGTSTGATLAPGSGTWSTLSDRDAKRDVVPVDPRDVLARVQEMPVSEWSYATQDGVRHMGPMAQDFHAAFGLGLGETTIDTVDADGVALAAIQGLALELEERDATIAAQEARLAALERQLASLMAAQPPAEDPVPVGIDVRETQAPRSSMVWLLVLIGVGSVVAGAVGTFFVRRARGKQETMGTVHEASPSASSAKEASGRSLGRAGPGRVTVEDRKQAGSRRRRPHKG